MPSNHLILCHPFLLLTSTFSIIKVFSNKSAFHIRWPKYWSFSFSISPSNEHSGLISLRIDWFDLIPVRGTLEGLLQYHNSKASIWCWVFFMDQHFYGPSRKLLKHLNYKAENAKLIFKQVPTTQKPSLNIKTQKVKYKITIWPCNSISRYILWSTQSRDWSSISMFVVALLEVAKRWKQLRCPFTDKQTH